MGKIVLRDCQITVNGVNLSDHVSSVEVHFVKDEVETTNFSGQGRERVAGLKGRLVVVNSSRTRRGRGQRDSLAAVQQETSSP